ncbi:MAG: thioredoxin family protein [Polyangiaceae bacterium]|jgi:thioredoxin 1|nr:thioredoxin family protein [Polyangiaceae bacterium]
MTVVDITADNFRDSIEGSQIVLIDCWAPWCGACKDFASVFETVADRHPEHTFGKLDTESNAKLVEALGISHIPTLVLYRDGIMLFNQRGYLDEEPLDDIVRQAESLDMNEVRAHLAKKDGDSNRAEQPL